jgi:protein-L-isoaspartate O-methyltransferase
MAWRSSGKTNEELVDNMVQNGLINNPEVEQGFRRVDRKFFVPKASENEAYSDRPIREGLVHISAPHIYCTVLEALELTPGASFSFLNIGSGSGYLTCIASAILGPKSIYYGLEIHEEALHHCRHAVAAWSEESSTTNTRSQPSMHFIHGNGLDIQSNVGESIVGFDRIYAGAAINKAQLRNIQKLLSPGGVLVAPVDDELIKVVRTRSSTLGNTQDNDEYDLGYTTQTISGVTFAPLLSQPKLNTIIPAAQWSTSNHHLYPDSFQQATKAILLCRNSRVIQPINKKPEEYTNLSASLPKEVWIHILSFTTRKWFEPIESEVNALRHETAVLHDRLSQEKTNLSQVRQALSEEKSKNYALHRSNEIYLQEARRYYEQLRDLVQLQNTDGSSAGILISPEVLASTKSLLASRRSILTSREPEQMDTTYETMREEDESDEDESDEDMDESDASQHYINEHVMIDNESHESEHYINDRVMFDNTSREEHSSEDNVRPARTVSISSGDL